MTCRFIDYEKTPNSGLQLGVATIEMYDKIILRFKVVQRKDGVGFFIGSPSVKVGEKYLDAIEIDSSKEIKAIDDLIRLNIDRPQTLSGSPIKQEEFVDQDLPF